MPDPRDLERLRISLECALLELPWSYKGYTATVGGECVGDTLDQVMDVVCEWLREYREP